MPVLLAGMAGGKLATGRSLRVPGPTTVNNVYLSILRLAGLPDTKFGMDSTGTIGPLVSSA